MIPKTHRASARDPRLTAGQRLLLSTLWHYADQQCQCWPSVETLALDLVCTPRDVKHRLARLVALGHIVRERDGRPSATTTIQIVNWPTVEKPKRGPRIPREGDTGSTPKGDTRSTPVMGDGDTRSTPGVIHVAPLGVIPVAPKRHGTPGNAKEEKEKSPLPTGAGGPGGAPPDQGSAGVPILDQPPIVDPPAPPDAPLVLTSPTPEDLAPQEPWKQLAAIHNRYRPKGGSSINVNGNAPRGLQKAIADHGLADLALICEGVHLLFAIEGGEKERRYYRAEMYGDKALGIWRDKIMRATLRRVERHNRFSSGWQADTLAEAVAFLRDRLERDRAAREGRGQAMVVDPDEPLPF